jgi:hypothetical protein
MSKRPSRAVISACQQPPAYIPSKRFFISYVYNFNGVCGVQITRANLHLLVPFSLETCTAMLFYLSNVLPYAEPSA